MKYAIEMVTPGVVRRLTVRVDGYVYRTVYRYTIVLVREFTSLPGALSTHSAPSCCLECP